MFWFGKMKHAKLKKWNYGKPYGTIWYHITHVQFFHVFSELKICFPTEILFMAHSFFAQQAFLSQSLFCVSAHLRMVGLSEGQMVGRSVLFDLVRSCSVLCVPPLGKHKLPLIGFITHVKQIQSPLD